MIHEVITLIGQPTFIDHTPSAGHVTICCVESHLKNPLLKYAEHSIKSYRFLEVWGTNWGKRTSTYIISSLTTDKEIIILFWNTTMATFRSISIANGAKALK